MRFITKTNWIIILIVLAVGALAVGTASSVSSCCGRPDPAPVIQPMVYAQPAPVIVARPAPVMISAPIVSRPACGVCAAPVVVQRPAFRTVRETVMKEEEITTYETVWDEETRYRTRTVCKRVPETSVKTETVRVSKPVWETVEKETSYDVVRYVQETSEREEVSTVCRPVTEYQERQITETVSRPVQETVMQQQCRQVNRPVTTCQTRVRDAGEYVTRFAPQPSRTFTRLTWQRGGDYFDPATGRTKYRLPGLYWTDLSAPTQYKAERVFESRMITESVPVTTLVPETVVEQVPVTVNKVVQEQVVRTEQVPVTRMVQEKVVKKIPVTTYKPVTEKVVQKTPVRVCRMETVDEVREIPVTTYKTVTETIQEPYTVKIARQVPKVVKVQRPVTVCRQVPIDPCNPCSAPVSSGIGPCGVTVDSASTSISDSVSTDEPEKAPTGADAIPTFNDNEAPASSNAADDASEASVKYPGPVDVKYDTNPVLTTDEPKSEDAPAIPHSDAAVKSVPDDLNDASADVKSHSTVLDSGEAVDQAPPMAEADKKPVLKENAPAAEDAPPTERSSQAVETPMTDGKMADPKSVTVHVNRPTIESRLVPEETAEEAAPSDSETTVRTASAAGHFNFSRSLSNNNQASLPIPETSPTRLLKY